jgi:hypothetical protein
MMVLSHDRQTTDHRHDVDREVEELRRSINARRTHGILYYLLLVAIFFVGFAMGYATHSLVGAAIILIGLALVALARGDRVQSSNGGAQSVARRKTGGATPI